MRRGHFNVSKEIMIDDHWPLIENELYRVFKLEAKEEKPFGVIAFHGISEFFDETQELTSPEYMVILTTEDNKPKFLKFEKI